MVCESKIPCHSCFQYDVKTFDFFPQFYFFFHLFCGAIRYRLIYTWFELFILLQIKMQSSNKSRVWEKCYFCTLSHITNHKRMKIQKKNIFIVCVCLFCSFIFSSRLYSACMHIIIDHIWNSAQYSFDRIWQVTTEFICFLFEVSTICLSFFCSPVNI